MANTKATRRNADRVEPFEQVEITGIAGPAIMAIHSAVLDSNGDIYFTDTFNHRVIKINPQGRFLYSIGERGSGPGEFWYPKGLVSLTVDGREAIAVCDSWNHRIQMFETSGALLATFGGIGQGEDDFYEPVAALADDDGALWVLDRCNNRVKACTTGGETLKVFGERLSLQEEDTQNDPAKFILQTEGYVMRHGYQFPESLVADGADGFFIADTGNRRIARVDKNGGLRELIYKEDSFSPPYFYPVLVAALPFGQLLVQDLRGSCYALDEARPWRWKEIRLFDKDDPGWGKALLARTEPAPELWIFDGAAGVINKHQIKNFIENTSVGPPEPKSFVRDSQPSIWPSYGGCLWKRFLAEAASEDLPVKLLKEYVSVSAQEAMACADALNQAEGEIFTLAVSYYEKLGKLAAQKGQDAAAKAAEAEVAWVSLQLKTGQLKRISLRKALIGSVALVAQLYREVEDDLKDTDAKDIFLSFAKVLESEFNNRTNDLNQIKEWFSGALKQGDKLSIPALTHACVAVVYLQDHLAYLNKSLVAFGLEGPYVHNAAFDALKPYQNDITTMVQGILWVAAEISMEFGFVDSARIICQAGLRTGFNEGYIAKSLEICAISDDVEGAKRLEPLVMLNVMSTVVVTGKTWTPAFAVSSAP